MGEDVSAEIDGGAEGVREVEVPGSSHRRREVGPRDEFGVDVDAARESYVFVGDSPNDSPMFAHFPHAVGVANVADFAGRLAHEPRYITHARGGAGFREVADLLLKRA